jgi:hypothetical protein
MIRVTCACGAHLKVPDRYLNRRVKCPRCGSMLTMTATAAVHEVGEPLAPRTPAHPPTTASSDPSGFPPSESRQGGLGAQPWFWPAVVAAGSTGCALIVLVLLNFG